MVQPDWLPSRAMALKRFTSEVKFAVPQPVEDPLLSETSIVVPFFSSQRP